MAILSAEIDEVEKSWKSSFYSSLHSFGHLLLPETESSYRGDTMQPFIFGNTFITPIRFLCVYLFKRKPSFHLSVK